MAALSDPDDAAATQMLSSPTLAPMPEWEAAMRGFGRDLARAIEAGSGRALLEAAAGTAA